MKQIDVLPNDVLLEIFDFYLTMDPLYAAATEIEPWRSLVHVCRRWRGLIFESPRRLNLQLLCTPVTSTRDKLDTWPALPLIVRGNLTSGLLSDMPVDNIIPALEQSNRVSQVTLWDLADWQLEEVPAAMQVPFPEFSFLQLSSFDETPPVSFLIRSWVDLPHVCETSIWMAFHFRDFQHCFYPLLTLSNFGSLIFLILGTFHPKRWSLSSALRQVSKRFPLDLNFLNLALTRKAEVCLQQNALSSPLLRIFDSKALTNI
jgi:hypothetical protein